MDVTTGNLRDARKFYFKEIMAGEGICIDTIHIITQSVVTDNVAKSIRSFRDSLGETTIHITFDRLITQEFLDLLLEFDSIKDHHHVYY